MSAIETLNAQWLAQAEHLDRVATKLRQRAIDIRHTVAMLERPLPPVLRCEECSAYEGEEHYAFCTHPEALCGEVVS